MPWHPVRARQAALVAAFVLFGTSCSIGGGLQPGIGVSHIGEDLVVHIAPCLLGAVDEVTLGEHVGGSRLAVGRPIYWQIRRTKDAPDPPSKIKAGETPDGFVVTVPFTRPPVVPNPRYSVLLELEVADAGSMSFQLQEQPGGSDVPSEGLIYNGEYKLVSKSAFDSTDACDPQGASVDDGILSKQDAEAFAPAPDPLGDPPTTGTVLLDLTSGSSAHQTTSSSFRVSGSYRVYAACSGTSIQVSDTFSPAPDEVWGQRSVVPCRGGWIAEAPDQPRPGTLVTVVVLPGTNATWRVVAVAKTS
ncbi:MAG: hypothetical protein ACRDHO_11800 [Actinomycetota bacterium]